MTGNWRERCASQVVVDRPSPVATRHMETHRDSGWADCVKKRLPPSLSLARESYNRSFISVIYASGRYRSLRQRTHALRWQLLTESMRIRRIENDSPRRASSIGTAAQCLKIHAVLVRFIVACRLLSESFTERVPWWQYRAAGRKSPRG